MKCACARHTPRCYVVHSMCVARSAFLQTASEQPTSCIQSLDRRHEPASQPSMAISCVSLMTRIVSAPGIACVVCEPATVPVRVQARGQHITLIARCPQTSPAVHAAQQSINASSRRRFGVRSTLTWHSVCRHESIRVWTVTRSMIAYMQHDTNSTRNIAVPSQYCVRCVAGLVRLGYDDRQRGQGGCEKACFFCV